MNNYSNTSAQNIDNKYFKGMIMNRNQNYCTIQICESQDLNRNPSGFSQESKK